MIINNSQSDTFRKCQCIKKKKMPLINIYFINLSLFDTDFHKIITPHLRLLKGRNYKANFKGINSYLLCYSFWYFMWEIEG